MSDYDFIDKALERLTQVEAPKQQSQKIKVFMTRKGTYVECDNSVMKKIKGYFTIKDKTIMGYEKITPKYYFQNNKYYIPRFGSFLLKNKFDVEYSNQIKEDNPANLIYEGEDPTDIQTLIIDDIFNRRFTEAEKKSGRCGVIVNLQAGFGKTYLSMMIMGRLKCRTIVVVHNCTILDQWKKLLIQKFPQNKIGVYYGNKKEMGDIVVAVINTVCQSDISGFIDAYDFFSEFDLAIFDECHEYCSASRSKVFEYCNVPFIIGLSATPDERNDNLTKVIKWGIGPILCAEKLKGYSTESVPFKGHVVRVKYCGPDEYTKSIINSKLETLSVPKMIEQFTQDTFRTQTIAQLALKYYKQKYNIFVFADRRDYLEEINIKISELAQNISEFLTSDEDLKSIRLVGGDSADKMETAKQQMRIILTTYQYMGTGCSIPKMNCIILATPRKNKSRQIINRIFRLGSDYSITRQIIDIVDWKTPLKNQYYERKKYYDSQSFTTEDLVIKHEYF
jgi:superfamily II DNA or RNA helicase